MKLGRFIRNLLSFLVPFVKTWSIKVYDSWQTAFGRVCGIPFSPGFNSSTLICRNVPLIVQISSTIEASSIKPTAMKRRWKEKGKSCRRIPQPKIRSGIPLAKSNRAQI